MNTAEKKKALIGAVVLGLIVIGLTLWYMATHPAPVPFTPTPQTATTTPQVYEKAEVSDAGQYYTATASYPASTPLLATAGAEADARAVSIMKGFATGQVEGFTERAGIETLTAEDIQIMGLSEDRKYTLDADFETSESATTITYIYLIYEDTLGAHPNGSYRTFTFDKATGDVVALDDLLEGQYLTRLSQIARRELPKNISAAYEGSEPNMEYIESGTTPTSENFQNFALKGDTLILIFPPYQVGPYALGVQMVEIPLSELADILAPAYKP